MSVEHVVIVGAGPAGLATARAYRAHGGEGEVTLLGDEHVAPYRRPPLTKEFLRGELDAQDLPLEQPDWFDAQRIVLRLGTSAQSIEPQRGAVVLAGGEELAADAIVMATGSTPLRPSIPGAEHDRVLTLRRLPDSRAISAHARAGQRAVVIGTGFIGCELGASLALKGARVTLVGQERLPQLARLGSEAALRIAAWLTELGVELRMDASVSAIEEGRVVELGDGARIAASLVVLATGVRPRGELAEAAGVETRDGAVVVDETMRSPAAGGRMLAAGDLALAYNASAGRHLRVEHWGDALEHGAVAGRALAVGGGGWRQVPGFWSSIGRRTLKYSAWGDGYDEWHLSDVGEDGGFLVHYLRDGATVGVLAHRRDGDYEHGRELILEGAPPP
jgi:3-phenylpropionate/trans-cinnamate dioxygenase ferredoxin reductase subunit